MRVLNAMLRMQKNKQVDVEKTSFLELNSMNMSHSSTKETIINELNGVLSFSAQRPMIQCQDNQ